MNLIAKAQLLVCAYAMLIFGCGILFASGAVVHGEGWRWAVALAITQFASARICDLMWSQRQ